MTSEEIKSRYSMRDIVGQYGFHPNRSGFISCPFHQGDRDPSMKIYDNSYYCFACGAHGDIFDFVSQMDGLTFREAFLSLGGTYEKETFQDRMDRYRAMKARDMKKKQEDKLRELRRRNIELIDIYRRFYLRATPLSDAWTNCYNALQYQLYLHEILNEPR